MDSFCLSLFLLVQFIVLITIMLTQHKDNQNYETLLLSKVYEWNAAAGWGTADEYDQYGQVFN